MKRFVVEVEDEINQQQLEVALAAGYFYRSNKEFTVTEVKENWERADGTPRMTTKQRDKLWQLCGGYNVPFREDNYYVHSNGMVEGWIGGPEYSHLQDPKPEKTTLYVGVEPDGTSHS